MPIRFQEYKPTPVLRGHLHMGGSNPAGERIDVNSQYLERGGKPFIAVMGEYHFSRDNRANWPQELAKMRAGGVTIVATYLFWIYHEETEGHFDFTGDLDIRTFILEAQRAGLEVVIRIGPWAHGECRNGGFPDWLQHKGFKLRDSNPEYMHYARIWYEKIFGQVQGLFYKDGGPIIGVQFENELVDNAEHLLDLKRLALEIGYDAPVYTVTGWNSRYGARIPVDDVMPVFAAYVEAPWASGTAPQPLSPHYAFDPNRNDSAVGMDLIRDHAPDGWRLPYERYPFATCELGSGLQSTHHRRINVSGMDAYALSLVKLGCGNNLIGYYMYHGGVNKIGKHSTFQESRATGYPNDVTIRGYDFHTCLGQYGQVREQYRLLNLLHLFVENFGSDLAPMEHVPAQDFIPCTDMEHLRCALRTDGQRGFVFVNHYQRMAQVADVFGAEISALGVELPPMDVKGDVAFLLPIRMDLAGQELTWATAQPLCRMGDTFFFAQIDGIPARYHLNGQVYTAEAGLNSGFIAGGVRIVTLTWEQAKHLRRLNGRLYLGLGCDLYQLDGQLHACEGGAFSYACWQEDHFVMEAVNVPFHPAVLTLEDVPEPFVPTYADELHLAGGHQRRWQKMTVTTAEGFVAIDGAYDVAQIYADGKMIADNFFSGESWQVPAALLFGRSCYLVTSPLQEGACYLEYRQPPLMIAGHAPEDAPCKH